MLQSVIYINIRETQSHTHTRTLHVGAYGVFFFSNLKSFVHRTPKTVFNLRKLVSIARTQSSPHSTHPPTARVDCVLSRILFFRSLPSRAVECTENKLKTTRGHDIFLPYIVTVLRKRKTPRKKSVLAKKMTKMKTA